MDKLEYIPGDLVMVKDSALRFAKDKIFKVISSLSCGFLNVVMLNDSSTTYSISNNAIRPIPLTPDILEKNGWKVSSECKWIYVKEDNVKIFRLLDDIHYAAYIGFVRLLEFQYIHQLQHLLFGLGLNSEMEV